MKNVSKVAILFATVLFLFGGTAVGEERFGGVGLSVEASSDGLVVHDVISGTDAQSQGILRGDVITSIDGAVTAGVDFGTLVGRLRGVVGSEVTLEVRRAGSQDAITFKIRRTEIVYPG